MNKVIKDSDVLEESEIISCFIEPVRERESEVNHFFGKVQQGHEVVAVVREGGVRDHVPSECLL